MLFIQNYGYFVSMAKPVIKNKIIKTKLVDWRSLEWLQGDLKELSDESFNKLKQSLKKNDFIMPFNVWNNGKTWILDGHHRKRALAELEKEGFKSPSMLPANFIDCKNKKEASKLVLVYSSIYASAEFKCVNREFNFEKLWQT